MDKKILFFSYARERSNAMCEILKKIQGKTPLDLLKKYYSSIEPPIDIEALTANIGISTSAIDFSEIESYVNIPSGSILGATVSKGENLNIFYMVNAKENRKRFTIAHELAHCCLHTDSLIDHHIEFRDSAKANSGKEFDANVFAGELLIPTEALHKICNQMIVPTLSALSQIFKVSTNVMAARLDYLNIGYYKDVEISEV